jgi:hypothetical protein
MITKQLSQLPARFLSLAACYFTCTLGASGQQVIQGVQIFPSNNVWNTRIDGLSVDKNSSKYVSSLGANTNFHPDWGSDPTYGIPYNLVTGNPATTPLVNFPTFQYADESDPGPYPTVTTSLLIEGSDWNPNNNGGDRHVLQVDTSNGVLYELYSTTIDTTTGVDIDAGSGAIFTLNSNMLRPNTWTSADAAGLPIFPGLVNYPDASAGPIKHAFRFTGRRANGFIWPARHTAGTPTAGFPPFGQRFRLKKSFTIPASASFIVKNIMTAMKQYGIIYADLGSDWYVSGAPNAAWLDSDLDALKALKGSDFEAVDESSLQVGPDSAAAPLTKPVSRPTSPPAPWPKIK